MASDELPSFRVVTTSTLNLLASTKVSSRLLGLGFRRFIGRLELRYISSALLFLTPWWPAHAANQRCRWKCSRAVP